MILLEVATAKNVGYATIGFLIMDSNFNGLYGKVVLIL